jgi:hypothetical protein
LIFIMIWRYDKSLNPKKAQAWKQKANIF